MLAFMAAAVALFLRDAAMGYVLAFLLGATVLSFVSSRQFGRSRAFFEQTYTSLATDAGNPDAKKAMAMATVIFFFAMIISTVAFSSLLLYGIPSLRPSDDYLSVGLILSVSVACSMLLASFFYGAIGGITSSAASD